MVKKLLLLVAALLPALASAACSVDSDCDTRSGAKCVSGKCNRTYGCTTNSECRTAAKTGNSLALCEPNTGFNNAGACYVPSRNYHGSSEGSQCGSGNGVGDDYECDRGLVCREFRCAKPETIETPDMCTTSGDCDIRSGAQCNNGQCSRTFTCTSNTECRSAAKTNNPDALCDMELNACFVPSKNRFGIPAGGVCGTADMPRRQGDDASCLRGLVCRNQLCTSFSNVATSCSSNSDCDTASGAMCVNGQCSRTFVCSTNAECRSAAKTGNPTALCDRELNACFVPSTNKRGLAEGEQCGTAAQPDVGDDQSCDAGLVCRNLVCARRETVAARCESNADCDTASGATCNGVQCDRTYNCGSDMECQSKTGNARAVCDRTANACYVPSTNRDGIPKGGTCGSFQQPGRAGDDISCDYGLVCRDFKCQDMVIGAGCRTNEDCGPHQTCVKPKNTILVRRGGYEHHNQKGTCTEQAQTSPYYSWPGLPVFELPEVNGPDVPNVALKRAIAGKDDVKAVIRGRQALTPRQYMARAARPS